MTLYYKQPSNQLGFTQISHDYASLLALFFAPKTLLSCPLLC